MSKAKPFRISKWAVWEAYKRVKANKGAAGVDGESIEEFEKDLKDNLYKLWNRMSSGSYFPPPVRMVERPKKDGGKRPLGIRVVSDRVAQTVAKMYFEPEVEPYFHPDSYGYRPGKSLLANLFLHYAFDEWMKGNFPSIPFERYADDIIVHCVSERQARWIKRMIEQRLVQCKLDLHPEKTKIVYCKDDQRRGSYRNKKFDFLGYTFRSREAKTRYGKFFVGFNPAVSNEAMKEMRRDTRSWRFHRRSDKSLEDLSHICNPILRGWINYYGQYYRSSLYRTFDLFNCILMRWAMRKCKKLKGHPRRATHWLARIAKRQPWLFAHWQAGFRPAAGR